MWCRKCNPSPENLNDCWLFCNHKKFIKFYPQNVDSFETQSITKKLSSPYHESHVIETKTIFKHSGIACIQQLEKSILDMINWCQLFSTWEFMSDFLIIETRLVTLGHNSATNNVYSRYPPEGGLRATPLTHLSTDIFMYLKEILTTINGKLKSERRLMITMIRCWLID